MNIISALFNVDVFRYFKNNLGFFNRSNLSNFLEIRIKLYLEI